MQRICFITEDDEALASFLQNLTAEGFEAFICQPTAEALDATLADPPELFVIDLPALGENEGVKRLVEDDRGREEARALVALLLPEQLGEFDPTLGFDDFLLRSAHPKELAARVRQVLWKKGRIDSRNLLRCGDLMMDLANYRVYLAGRPVNLTYKEYQLLLYLATNRDRVFSRETLLSKVWGYDFYGGARTVDVHIRRLRSKIEDHRHTFIETVRNVGYRFRASL